MFRNPGAFAGRVVPVLMILLVAAAFTHPGSAEAFTVSGEVSFEGVSSSPYPSARVALLQPGTTTVLYETHSSVVDGSFEIGDVTGAVYDIEVSAPCWTPQLEYNVEIFAEGPIGPYQLTEGSSGFSTITLVGDFNSWNTGAPPMSFTGSCTWSDTLALDAGSYLFKFVTDGAFDNDYGGVQSTTLDIPGGPFWAIPGVAGEGTAISVQATLTGDYRFTLNEATQSWTAEYLGVIPNGSITGTVAFQGIPTPPAPAVYPTAVIELLEAGTSTVVRTTYSDPSSRTFNFNTVSDGTYDVRATAHCFDPVTESNVTVTGSAVDIGELTLVSSASEFSTIQLASDFTTWDLGTAPSMDQLDDCTWSVVVPASAGTYFMKFVTNGSWGNDYGGNQSVTFTAPGAFPVTAGVSGENAIKIELPQDDTYTFVLDEATQTFAVTGSTPVERTSWGAIKARY